MKVLSTGLIVSLSVLITACSHYSEDLSALERRMDGQAQQMVMTTPQDIMPAAGGDTPLPFHEALAREYYTLARFENDKAYDYKAAKLFTEKARDAAAGKRVIPSRVADYSLPRADMPELNAAREKLLAALQEKSSPVNGAYLAKAQTSFDCWLERAEEARDEMHAAACKESFETAMVLLEQIAPAAGIADDSQPVDIVFPYNSTIIGSDFQAVLDDTAYFLKSNGREKYTAVITGYIDVENPSAMNRQLAKSRALVVNQALIQRGVPLSALKPQIAPIPVIYTRPGQPAPVMDEERYRSIVQIHLVPPEETRATKRSGG